MRKLWAEYRICYRDCTLWLARYFVPWRWVLGTWQAIADLRAEMLDQLGV